MGELLFMTLLGVMGVVFFFDTGNFRVSLMDRSGGAAMFPRIAIVLMLILIVMRSIVILRDKNRRHFVFWEAFMGERLVYLIALVTLVFTIKPIGFLPTMSAFMLFMVNYFYYRTHGTLGTIFKLIVRSALLVGFVGIVYFFFTSILHVMLPPGIMG